MNREKVWLYCRIDKGGNMSEEMLETHRYRLEEYAAEHGLSIMGISRDIQNGINFDRPGLLEVNRAVEEHLVDIVLVFNLNRLCRHTEDMIRYWNFLKQNEVRLCTVADGFVNPIMDSGIATA